jgi:hypothetical protein
VSNISLFALRGQKSLVLPLPTGATFRIFQVRNEVQVRRLAGFANAFAGDEDGRWFWVVAQDEDDGRRFLFRLSGWALRVHEMKTP